MATETWVIKVRPHIDRLYNWNITFTSNNTIFNSMAIKAVDPSPIPGSGGILLTYGDDTYVYYNHTKTGEDIWLDQAYRTVTFEKAPTGNLLTWLQANATKQESTSKVSVDLTTLPGWSSLSSGSHNITIVAKADGYRDSEPSEGVTVTKEAEADALAGTWVFNDTISYSDCPRAVVSFTSNEMSYTEIYGDASNPMMAGLFYGSLCVFSDTKGMVWENDAYKTIVITSKLSEVTDGDALLAWLQANATKQS